MSYKLIILCIALAVFCGGCGTRTEIDDNTQIVEKNNTTENIKNTEGTEQTTKHTEPETISVMEDVDLIEHLFDINEAKYQIVKVDNQLDDKEYGGGYTVVVKVKKEDMSIFIRELEDKMYIREVDHEGDKVLIKNITGKSWDEDDVVYYNISKIKRFVEGDNPPRAARIHAIYSNVEEEEYEITLDYAE